MALAGLVVEEQVDQDLMETALQGQLTLVEEAVVEAAAEVRLDLEMVAAVVQVL